MRRSVLALLATAGLLSSCGIFRGDGDAVKTPTVGERLPVLSFEAQLEADPELASVEVQLPPALRNAEWTQPGGNAAKALHHLTLGANPAPAWSVSIGQGSTKTRRLTAAPVVAGGRVYAIDARATVSAFDAATGRSVWSATIGAEEGDEVAFGGGVSTDGTRVYATSGYGVAVAFDARSGTEVWRRQVNAPLRGSPAVAAGRVYVLTQDNQLYALDAATGAVAWEATGTVETAGLLGAATPAVALDTVVVGFSSGELAALRPENGRTVWQDALARTGRTTTPLSALADIDASPVIDQGRVFAIGHGGRMVALELATGQRVWERNLAGTSIPWSAGDFLFTVSVDGELVALSRGDGRIRWVTKLRRWKDEEDRKDAIRWFGPVLASDRLILTNSNRQLVFVSPRDGEPQQMLRLQAPAFLPPVVAADMLFVLTDDGRLTAYR